MDEDNKPALATVLGYYGIFYLIFLVLIIIGYGPAQQYAKPIAKFIFPINENNSWLKTVIVMSGMYWSFVGVSIFLNSRKKDS